MVDRIDTHTYGGSDRAGLQETAKNAIRNLWISEVDGTYIDRTMANSITTYIIEGVDGIKPASETDNLLIKQIAVTAD